MLPGGQARLGYPRNRPGILVNIQSLRAGLVLSLASQEKRGLANPNQMAPVPVAPVYINEDPEAGTAARDICKLCPCAHVYVCVFVCVLYVCVWVNRPTDN